MKKLGISKARDLLKREFGISAANLEMPPMMNQNPKYPWYELKSGNLLVELSSTEQLGNMMIRLHMSFNDGLGSLTRYFYADTLEEAPEFTERNRWDEIVEQVESCEYSHEGMQHRLMRLSNDARDAYRQHTKTVQLRSVAAEQYEQVASMQESDDPEFGRYVQ